MRRILVPVVALLLAASAATGFSQVLASSGGDAVNPPCDGGVLGSDAVGDTNYPPADVNELEDPALDLVEVRATPVVGDTFTVTLKVADLTEADPPAGTHALYGLTLASDGGPAVELQINRSNAMGEESATVDGADVTYTVDLEANELVVTIPRAAIGEGATVLSLVEGSAASSVVAGGFIVDEIAGRTCAVHLDAASGERGRPAENPGNSWGNDRVPGQGNGNGKGNVAAVPASTFDPTKVTVAVIDSGLHGAHEEFDFDETRSEPNGQLVAWWDFSGANTTGKTPDLWYEERAPYDTGASGSHGTGTSAMAVGRNIVPSKTPSACPGCRLAFAKTLNETADDVLDGDIPAAIRWAVDVVGADVINMSIGAAAPIPEALVHIHEAAAYARSKGVLMVVSNGNGWGNAGVPGQPGGLTPYGNSTQVLSVGASEVPDSVQVSTDPEVTALFTVITGENTGGYHEISGTSFSSPFVAGAAARLVAEARVCGADHSPDAIERLLKITAKDTDTPPMFEGYGTVDLETVRAAIDVLCHGAESPAPDPLTEGYVENVSATQRQVWTEQLADVGSSTALYPTPMTDVSGPGILGPSAPIGAADTEIYELTIPAGGTIDATIGYGPSPLAGAGVSDFDVFLYRAEGDTYGTANFLALAGESAEIAERLTYTNTSRDALTVRIAIVGWSIAADQPITLAGLDSAALVFDGYTLGEHVAGHQAAAFFGG